MLRYALRFLGLRTEFYRMAADDPTYAKMILPALENLAVIAASDELEELLEILNKHMATQRMKRGAILCASNATKRGGKSSNVIEK